MKKALVVGIIVLFLGVTFASGITLRVNSSCWGPEPPWACLNRGNYSDAYITSKAVDASNYESVNLRFYFAAYFYYPQYVYFYIKVRMNETSPWKDITPWDNPPMHYLEPFIYEIKIILGPGGCADAFQVNWSYHGYYYYFNCAFLDDVMIYSPDTSFKIKENNIAVDNIVHSPTVLLYENFSGPFPPEGWSTDWWTQCHPNNPPDAPTIDGPTSGKPGEELCWTFQTCDPDGDDIMYIIDWGDGESNTTDCYPSCTEVEVCHTYYKKGMYIIKAIAQECPDGLISSEATLKVTVPRNKATSNSLFLWFLERFPLLERLLNGCFTL